MTSNIVSYCPVIRLKTQHRELETVFILLCRRRRYQRPAFPRVFLQAFAVCFGLRSAGLRESEPCHQSCRLFVSARTSGPSAQFPKVVPYFSLFHLLIYSAPDVTCGRPSLCGVICFYPVEVQDEVKSDEAKQDAAAAFMKNLERPGW